ncbi:hypothetical protein L0152_32660, partial [bacterium]|nr:hypothetical protein [bacterium]
IGVANKARISRQLLPTLLYLLHPWSRRCAQNDELEKPGKNPNWDITKLVTVCFYTLIMKQLDFKRL